MKNFILLLFLVAFSTTFSQTYTEKYNSLLKRYEHFDSKGNLIGYKEWNSLLNQWEYHSAKTTKSNPIYSQDYIEPYDFNLMNKVLTTKQRNYDYNLSVFVSELNKLNGNVNNNNNLTPDEKKFLQNTIRNSVDEINSKNADFSSSSITNYAIDYLYQNYNNAINTINSRRKANRK